MGIATGDRMAPEIVDQRLAKALAHPLRVRILAALSQRRLSPVEFSRETGESLGTVSYHFRKLEKLGCAEVVATAPRRGSTEHYYRGTKRALFAEGDWKQLPKSIQGGVSAAVLQTFVERARAAIEAGTFDSRDDSHFSWVPLHLDEEGWKSLASILERTLAEVMELEAEARERLGSSGEAGVTATFALAAFESPPSESTTSD